MMKEVSVGEAARSFVALLKAAEDGEEVVITRNGKAVAKLTRVDGVADPLKPRFRSRGFKDHS
jgi:prevent-host-death family protein